MNQQQFKTLEQSLYDKGYQKFLQHWHNEDFMLCKSFHKKDNKWEEDRAAYQILLSIYDWTSKEDLRTRLPSEVLDHVGIEVHIDVSRIVDEKIDLVISWHDTTSIEEVEQYAENFYQWVCTQWPKPRE